MSVINYESITVSTVAKNITATLIDQHHDWALVTVETAPVRFRLDGTAPTTSEGHLLNVGDVLELRDGELSGFGVIRSSGTDAVIKVSTGVHS